MRLILLKTIGKMNIEFKTKNQSVGKRWKLLKAIIKKEENLCKKIKSLIDKQGLNQDEAICILDEIKKLF